VTPSNFAKKLLISLLKIYFGKIFNGESFRQEEQKTFLLFFHGMDWRRWRVFLRTAAATEIRHFPKKLGRPPSPLLISRGV